MRRIGKEIQKLEIDTEKRILIINGKKVEEPIVVCTPGPEGWMNSFLLNYEKPEPGQNPIPTKRLVISIEVRDREDTNSLEHIALERATTKDLVKELERREGIEKRWLEPGRETIPQVSSPTILLIVTD